MKKLLALFLTALFATACNAKPNTEEAPKPMTQNNKVLVVFFPAPENNTASGTLKKEIPPSWLK